MGSTLSPERRAEGLAAAGRARRSELIALAEHIAGQCDVEVLEAPAAATLMVQLQAAVGQMCLGEVIVTYATVRVDGRDGWGCVAGWDDEAALAASLCDAVADSRVESLVNLSLETEESVRRARAQTIAATRLDLA